MQHDVDKIIFEFGKNGQIFVLFLFKAASLSLAINLSKADFVFP